MAESEGIMKGLLVKDFNILLLQKKFLGMVLMISIILLLTAEDPSFLVGYITVMCGIITVSTINYDEFDNGNTFLFTLPITRKGYVLEKYVLVMLFSGLAWVAATLASILFSVVKLPSFDVMQGIGEAVLVFVVCMMFEFIMIPIQLKYGGEKSKVVMVAMVGIVVVLGTILKFVFEKLEGVISIDVEGLIQTLDSIGFAEWIVIVVVASVAVMMISMSVSRQIMEKKQF